MSTAFFEIIRNFVIPILRRDAHLDINLSSSFIMCLKQHIYNNKPKSVRSESSGGFNVQCSILSSFSESGVSSKSE